TRRNGRYGVDRGGDGMSKRKGKLPPSRTVDSQLVMRDISYREPSLAVIATENPISRWDDETQQTIDEVLLMDGVEFRGDRDQIPTADSHDSSSVRNIFGSIQSIRVRRDSGELVGVPVFASDADSQVIATRVSEGHITDFSITAEILEQQYVPAGRTYTTPRGVEIPGPARIVTRWVPHDASICATGADEYSTIRRSYAEPNRKVKRAMDEALLAKASALGLPDGVTDPSQVIAFLIGKATGDGGTVENKRRQEQDDESNLEEIINQDDEEDVVRSEEEDDVERAEEEDTERKTKRSAS